VDLNTEFQFLMAHTDNFYKVFNTELNLKDKRSIVYNYGIYAITLKHEIHIIINISFYKLLIIKHLQNVKW